MRFYINAIDRIPPFWSDINPHPLTLQGLFPDLNPHLQRLSAEAEQALHVFQFKPDNSYLAKWSLSVQRMLAADLVAEIGYNGSRGIHLPARRGLGVARPQFVNGETFYPATETVLFNTCCSRIEYYDTSADSWYHAMQATLTKRAGAGLHFQGNYTWAQSLDTRSSSLGGEFGGSAYMDPFNSRRDKSRSDFSLAHVFTGNASYRLPWGNNLTGLAGGLLGGWQMSGIFTAQTGRPFSLSSNGMITHPLVDAGRPDLIPGGNNNPILGGIDKYFDPTQFRPQQRGFYGNLGRNTLTGPGRVMFDASVLKNVRVGEDKTIQFRVEAFNILNHANFSLPVSSLYNARGVLAGNVGRISTLLRCAGVFRAQLSARKRFETDDRRRLPVAILERYIDITIRALTYVADTTHVLKQRLFALDALSVQSEARESLPGHASNKRVPAPFGKAVAGVDQQSGNSNRWDPDMDGVSMPSRCVPEWIAAPVR